MTLVPIRIVPDPVLRAKAAPIAKIDHVAESLLDDMLQTMYDAPGIGLAAPQIGVSLRAIVMDLGNREDRAGAEVWQMINPEIIARSDEESAYEEGCLSIPGVAAEVVRPAMVRVRYLARNGKTEEMEASGLLATCVQHEIDHLNGVLYIDYISKLKRDVLLRKMKKLLAEKADDTPEREHNL
jgi:peptide deformylase